MTLKELIKRIDQATKPRNPELEYGDDTTVAATRDVRDNPEAQRVMIDGKVY